MKRHSSRNFATLVLIAALAALPSFDSVAWAQADFYKGKTIRIMVGSTPGSFYDLWGRLLDYGTVVVSGTGGTREAFAKIADPLRFRTEVQSRVPV